MTATAKAPKRYYFRGGVVEEVDSFGGMKRVKNLRTGQILTLKRTEIGPEIPKNQVNAILARLDSAEYLQEELRQFPT